MGQYAARKVGRFYPLFQHTQVHSDLNGSGSGRRDVRLYSSTMSTLHTPAKIFFASEHPVEYFTCTTVLRK